MRPFRLLVGLSTILVLASWVACTGVIGEGTTYNDLAGVESVQVTDGVALTLEQNVVATAKPHVGELDMLHLNLGRLNTLGEAVGEHDVLVTVEAANGAVLDAEPLGLTPLRDTTRELPTDDVQVHRQTRDLNVPHDLVESGEFRANLFVCIDADRDLACGDQLVEQLFGGADFEAQQVVAFVPLWVTVDGTQLAARPLQPTDPGYTAVEDFMANSLKNYDPAALGLNGVIGATVTLATLAAEVETEVPPPDPNPEVPNPEDPPQDPPPEGKVCNLDVCMDTYLAAIEANGYEQAFAEYEECIAGCEVFTREQGCFVTGTRIATGAEQSTRIERLVPGDRVMTSAGKIGVVVRAVTGPERNPIVRVETASGASLEVTRGHPMVTGAGLKRAAELAIGDRLVVAGGELSGIASLSSIDYNGLVFNIALAGSSTAEHLVVAEGVVTGDLSLQEQLAGDSVATR